MRIDNLLPDGARWRQARVWLVPAAMVGVALAVVTLFPREHSARHIITVSTPGPVAPASIKVYISGAVQRPGVYTLKDGDRLQGLVQVAGGPADDADLDAVNLATYLRDAQQVLIPRHSETAAVSAALPAGVGSLVNVNTASRAELEALPDIGVVRAQRIIDSRATAGPFREPRDLVARQLLTERIFGRLRDRLTVQ